MTLRHLKIFTIVYTERNMTAAAKKLFMTQPSVSQAIKELESHYKVILFERFPKSLKPTASGDVLFEYATNMLEMNSELEDIMKAGSSQHIIRIGANDTMGSTILDTLVREYASSHPMEQLKVSINRSSLLSEMLRANELDLILTDEFKAAPDLTSEIIGEDEFVPVASPSYNYLPKDNLATAEFLAKNRLLVREPGSESREYLERYMNNKGYTLSPFWESISYDILLSAAIRGLGISILPRKMISNPILKGELIELTIPSYRSIQTFSLAWQKGKYFSAPIEGFINLCREHH